VDIDHLLKLTTAARDEAVADGRAGHRHDELMAYLAGAAAGPGVEVAVHDVDLMRRQVCDRVRQHVLGRIATYLKPPLPLLDVVRNRREGALAELRLLDAELLPAVRSVGGVAPTEDELSGVELDLLSAHTLPVRQSTIDLLRRLLASCGR